MAIVKVLNGALTEQSNGEIVLRGTLDPESLDALHADDYQREVLVGKGKNSNAMVNAVDAKVHFPDIEVGMRGQKYDEAKNGTFTLYNPVFIIDGLQRTSALRAWRDKNPGKKIPATLGVKVHFGTNYKSEKEMFTLLNGSSRRRVSPNILLRNQRDQSEALLTLYALSMNDPDFPLHGRVTWGQAPHQRDLLTAMNYAKAIGNLTRRFVPKSGSRAASLPSAVRGGGNTRDQLPAQLNAAAKAMGLAKFRQAVIRFYELVDKTWEIRKVTHKGVTHLKGNFLLTLASILNDHDNFWNGADLVVDSDFRRRLKSFNLEDPTVARMASAGHMAVEVLYRMLVKHLDARRRENNRLEKRKG